MGSVLWGTMASDLAVWAAFGVTVVVLASAIMFFVKRGVGVSRAAAWRRSWRSSLRWLL